MPTARHVSHKAPLPVLANVDASTNEILACLSDIAGDGDASKAVKADAIRTIIEVAASHLRRLERT